MYKKSEKYKMDPIEGWEEYLYWGAFYSLYWDEDIYAREYGYYEDLDFWYMSGCIEELPITEWLRSLRAGHGVANLKERGQMKWKTFWVERLEQETGSHTEG